MKGRVPGVRRKSIKENHLKEGIDIREETGDVILELRRKHVPKRPGLTQGAGKLMRCLPKVSE